jgi:hypothetical protein
LERGVFREFGFRKVMKGYPACHTAKRKALRKAVKERT